MNYPDELKTKMDMQAHRQRESIVRQELGCKNEQCFCTGRCRQTKEEADVARIVKFIRDRS